MSDKKGAIGRVLLVLAGLVGIVGVAGGAAYWAATAAIRTGPGRQPAAAGPKAALQDGVLLDVGEFTTNLADPGGRRLIRLKLEVSLSDEKAKGELEKRKPALRDAVLGVLRSKSVADLNQERGMELLRGELQKKAAALVTQGRVLQVFITDIAVQ